MTDELDLIKASHLNVLRGCYRLDTHGIDDTIKAQGLR